MLLLLELLELLDQGGVNARLLLSIGGVPSMARAAEGIFHCDEIRILGLLAIRGLILYEEVVGLGYCALGA